MQGLSPVNWQMEKQNFRQKPEANTTVIDGLICCWGAGRPCSKCLTHWGKYASGSATGGINNQDSLTVTAGPVSLLAQCKKQWCHNKCYGRPCQFD